MIDNEPQRLREEKVLVANERSEFSPIGQKTEPYEKCLLNLRGFGIGQALSKKIVDRFGPQTMGIVQRQPYRLCREIRGVGFRTADAIAREANMPLDAPERAEAGLLHLLVRPKGMGTVFFHRQNYCVRWLFWRYPKK